MTRFAGQDNILGRIQELEKASEEGSVPYLTPYMSSQKAPRGGSRGRSYFDYIEDKRKELDDIVNRDGGPWKKPDKPEEEVKPVEPEPEKPEEPKDEKTDGRKFTEKLYGGKSMTDEELTWRMKLNPATTPEDWARAFGKCRTTRSSDKHASIPSDCYWPEEGVSSGSDFYSVGGGRQQGSGKGVTRENSALGLGFSLGQFARGVSARFSPTQGKVGGGRKNTATRGGRTAPGGQGAGAMRSDIQLKENITYINTSPEGHSIYEWNYKGEPESRRYQGVMAQDLLETAPHAVVTMDDGYLGVKYDEIDVNFIAI